MASVWTLAPGDRIRRTELHKLYRGGGQGGISPSRGTPNVLIFSDPKAGLKHGYLDHWNGELFHYTGEGRFGDQQMVKGNKAILQHAEKGRALRVFKGVGGIVEYVGEFTLDAQQPWYRTDARESGDGPVRPIRQVIVFKLRPTAGAKVASLPAPKVELPVGVVAVALNDQNTESFWVGSERPPYEADRVEAALVNAFKSWIEGLGHEVSRLRIVPPGEAKPIFSDVWIPALNLLVEAKGTGTREAVRMAIGQLIDYGRGCPDSHRAVLLPSRPRPDLVDLLRTASVFLIWRDGSRFIFESPAPEMKVPQVMLQPPAAAAS